MRVEQVIVCWTWSDITTHLNVDTPRKFRTVGFNTMSTIPLRTSRLPRNIMRRNVLEVFYNNLTVLEFQNRSGTSEANNRLNPGIMNLKGVDLRRIKPSILLLVIWHIRRGSPGCTHCNDQKDVHHDEVHGTDDKQELDKQEPTTILKPQG